MYIYLHIYTYVVVTTRPTLQPGISDIAKLPEARCRLQLGRVQDILQMLNLIGKSMVFRKAKGRSCEKNYPSCIAIEKTAHCCTEAYKFFLVLEAL